MPLDSKEESIKFLRGGSNGIEKWNNLRNQYVNSPTLLRIDLREADLSGANLGGVNLWRVDLSGANLSGAIISGATLGGANLSRTNLIGADLSKAILNGSDLRKAFLRKAFLNYSNLWLVDLRGADLREAKLKKAKLKEADLWGADLSGADLSGAKFKNAKLKNAKLKGVDLSGANLRGADLSGANLSETKLRRADLSEANLNGANLKNASLSGTIVEKSNFESILLMETAFNNVNLSKVVGLEKCKHNGRSLIDFRTLQISGKLSEVFLRGCGLPNNYITYINSLVSSPIEYYSCFISYSHTDKSFAIRLHDALQDRGIRCWLDEHQLLPGDDIYEAIDQGVRLWDKVLLCCTEEAMRSWWVDKEISSAFKKEQKLFMERNKKVNSLIPLNLDGHLFSEDFESGKKIDISTRIAADFTGWEKDDEKFEREFEKVVIALRADGGGREIPPPSKF